MTLNLPSNLLFPQHATRDNFTGNWENPSSWTPVWAMPQKIIFNFDATIWGYIRANSSLHLNGTVDNLVVNDTLVIQGDLDINNSCQLLINDNGIVIVRGNLNLNNQAKVTAKGYLIITDNLTKSGSITQGSFSSNDNPARIFIGGSVNPAQITANSSAFPVLNCSAPTAITYQGTSCTYGNMADLKSDPIYPFFQTTCLSVTATATTPVCEGDTLKLTSSNGISFIWTGPAGFSSNEQNSSIPNVTPPMAGEYWVTVKDQNGCSFSASTSVSVTPSPILIINDPAPVCFPATIDITAPEVTFGSDPGMIFSYWADPDTTLLFSTPSRSPGGTYYIKGTIVNKCPAIKPVKVIVNPVPVVSITSPDNPMCKDEVRTLTGNPVGGIFFLDSGPGKISGNNLSVTDTGTINITYTYTDKCTNSASQVIKAIENPVVQPGPDQELNYAFETKMAAVLVFSQTGEWSLASGSGQIEDVHSPVTKITGLKIGESLFKWSVRSGNCEKSANVTIIVNDLFIPSVITPNGDGKNDYFRLNALIGKVELMIFNRWGIIEYSTSNYLNDWDGHNDKGNALKSDVYFYILKFGNGLVKKGTVLIIR